MLPLGRLQPVIPKSTGDEDKIDCSSSAVEGQAHAKYWATCFVTSHTGPFRCLIANTCASVLRFGHRRSPPGQQELLLAICFQLQLVSHSHVTLRATVIDIMEILRVNVNIIVITVSIFIYIYIHITNSRRISLRLTWHGVVSVVYATSKPTGWLRMA